MRLDHAAHNEDLCRKLHSENIFFDWVVISAFYSALHYAEYELFPFQIGKGIYDDFDKYYKMIKMDRDNKHDARLRLVYSNINKDAGSAYQWLKTNCWNARYYDYLLNQKDANDALNKLDIIKSHLSKLLTIS